MTVLDILWVGIIFNLCMVMLNFAIPYRSRFSQWYYEKSGGPKMMASVWAALFIWMVLGAMR